MLLTTTTLLSERADPSPLWFGIFPKRGIGPRNNEHFPRPLRQSEARLRLARSPSCGAPDEGGAGGGSAPPFLDAGASPASVKPAHAVAHD